VAAGFVAGEFTARGDFNDALPQLVAEELEGVGAVGNGTGVEIDPLRLAGG